MFFFICFLISGLLWSVSPCYATSPATLQGAYCAGDHHGDVHNHFHNSDRNVAPLEGTEEPQSVVRKPVYFNCSEALFPKSLGTQDKVFVNRTQDNGEPYLRSIFHNLFRQGEPESASTCVVLCALDGMGGVGKTTLATEYAWAYGRHYNAIFWMDASSENSLKKSYASLINKLAGKQTAIESTDQRLREDLAAEAIQKLAESSYEKWLLICDNAEQDRDVDDLLHLPRGHVLCTSRYTGWRNKINVGLLKEEEAIELILLRFSGHKGVDIGFVDNIVQRSTVSCS